MRLFFLFFSLSFLMLYADVLGIDSSIARVYDFAYKSAQNTTTQLPKERDLFIVTFEKETSLIVNNYLAKLDPKYLDEQKALFITDVSKIPSFMFKMFVVPQLQKYKHPVFVHQEEGLATVIPKREDAITLLFVAHGHIVKIAYATTQEELQKAFEEL